MVKLDILQKVYECRDLDELRGIYDSWAETYDSTISGTMSYRGHEYIVDAVRPHLGDDAKILDAGAGSGMVGLAASLAGFTHVDAMDFSAGMLKVARDRGVYREIRRGVLGEALDYPDNTYDAVLSSGVFTPGHAPPTSFDEIIRIVKPGGLVCFTLRHDQTPPGFIEKFDELARDGLWQQVRVSEPFQSMPGGEPEIRHRTWLFRLTPGRPSA